MSYILIITVFVSIIYLWYNYINYKEESEWYSRNRTRFRYFVSSDFYVPAIISAIICFVIWLLLMGSVYVWIRPAFFKKIEYRTEYFDIYSLGHNNGVNGSFILGSGQINNQQFYTVLVITENGYTKQNINYSNSNRVYLKNTDKETPKVRITYDIYESKISSERHEAEAFKTIILPEFAIEERYSIWE